MKKIFISSLIVVFIIVFTIMGFNLNFNTKIKYIYLDSEYKKTDCSFNWYFIKIKNISVNSNVDVNNIGLYKEECSAKYIINYKKERLVNVREEEGPVISLDGTGNVCPGSDYKEEGFKAIDNHDGDITNDVKVIKNDKSIIYIVQDSSNNVVSIKRDLVITDNEPPKIELKDGDIKLYKGSNYEERGYKASDNCKGDLTSDVMVEGSVDTNNIGDYYITYKVSDGVNSTESKRKVSIVKQREGEAGSVYLTFDDGPNPGTTDKILDVLKKYNVKATFFVVPKNPDNYYLIKRAYDEGHSIGIHSYTHDYEIVYASDESFYNDVNKTNDIIEQITGKRTNLYRYPGGSSNTVSFNYSYGIVSRTSDWLHNNGFHYFDWNVSSGDAAYITPPSETIYNNITWNLSKYRSNVVLMHDVKENTANTIEDVIKYCLDNDYNLLPITYDTPEVHHGIAN